MVEQATSWAQFENANLTSTADVSVWSGLLGGRPLTWWAAEGNDYTVMSGNHAETCAANVAAALR